jgi:hypothetical protein
MVRVLLGCPRSVGVSTMLLQKPKVLYFHNVKCILLGMLSATLCGMHVGSILWEARYTLNIKQESHPFRLSFEYILCNKMICQPKDKIQKL